MSSLESSEAITLRAQALHGDPPLHDTLVTPTQSRQLASGANRSAPIDPDAQPIA